MPSNTSINLKSSAAAAFCARLLVHPLDNVKLSIQSVKVGPHGLIPRLEYLLVNIRQELRHQQKRHERLRHASKFPLKHLSGDTISMYRGLYKGVSFALAFQVPALAVFLSTYDATKHAISSLAHSIDLNSLHIHHCETHLLSGMMAKASAAVIWTPMNRIQNFAAHPGVGQVPLTFRDACQLARQLCQTGGASRVWSGYSKSFTSFLPYTMLYFATYEQLKMLARPKVSSEAGGNRLHSSTEDNRQYSWGAFREYWSVIGRQSSSTVYTELTPNAYMLCVASAVIVSSAVCEAASTARVVLWDPLVSPRAKPPSSGNAASMRVTNLATALRKQPMSTSPLSPLSPPKTLPSAFSTMVSTGTYTLRYPPFMPAQFKASMSSTSTMISQVMAGLPWQQTQHATLTTTGPLKHRSMIGLQHVSKPVLTGPVQPLNLLQSNIQALPVITTTSPLSQTYKPNNLLSISMPPATTSSPCNDNEVNKIVNCSNTKTNTASGLLRTIARKSGARILWTVPGVTLTTAGFEVLRDLALRSDMI
ncbi:mitochondrial carrier domain-containing protein [Gamsiella multidivaricata]|uniref:mitochondrial carrier domain-containing protein n=1 Tax=Gamsiella multidivaricata TaxID=101098 RepID=UPI00221F3CAB|nr:mitochondrial carrier domain-containing protein [Gamsiella multidivaricata]KAI7819166.1 mitochondrial carrier domain-containing protein [Gamsiella multidivaricata]